MHAVINHLHLDIPIEDLVEPLNREGLPILAAQPGFINFYLVKEAEDRGAVIIVWDNEEHAVNGGKLFGPTWFATNVAPHLASDQVRTVGQVLVKHS